MLFLSHSVQDICSFIKVRRESNAKIIWRCWVKVKKKILRMNLSEFLFYFIEILVCLTL